MNLGWFTSNRKHVFFRIFLHVRSCFLSMECCVCICFAWFFTHLIERVVMSKTLARKFDEKGSWRLNNQENENTSGDEGCDVKQLQA